jgi:hypothetical protein
MMAQTEIVAYLDEYRRQVEWLLVQAGGCDASVAGAIAAMNFHRRARNLQAVIARYEKPHA